VNSQSFAAVFDLFRAQDAGLASAMQSLFHSFEHAYRLDRKTRVATTPHLDLLGVFGFEFKELRHSDVFAWFLRPTAEHEQGSIFANALLKKLGLAPISDENYTVDRERHNRTDVALYSSGRFAIFIENKVRHDERDEQIRDMVKSLVCLSSACDVPRENRFAIFLTDSGKKPETGPDADSLGFTLQNLISMSRVDLFEAFRTALVEQPTYSPLLMNLIESYLNAIRRLRFQIL